MAHTKVKQVVVTGVSRGLGQAIVMGMTERGHTVYGCARSADAIEALGRQFQPPNDFCTLDVCDEHAVADWARRVIDAAGPPDLLINSAAIINANAPLWEVPAEEFRRVTDINLGGVANVIRHFVPSMVERRRGVVVNFSSTWGRTTSPEVAPYCATKWGIEGLTQALAQDLPSGMAAVAFNPGVINTAMLQSCFGEAAATYPDPVQWAERAVPYLLELGPSENGASVTAPS